MPYLTWSPDWATGFRDIDEQHQSLIQQINQLEDARAQNDAMQAMQLLFDFVAEMMSHFAYEEEMLKEADFKLLNARHTIHQNFVERLLAYQERVFEDLTLLDELLPQIKTWIQRHIELNDKAYVNAVKASGIYVENQEGIWERTGVAQVHEGSFQNAATETVVSPSHPFELIKAEEPSEKVENKEDDAPRSWARGA